MGANVMGMIPNPADASNNTLSVFTFTHKLGQLTRLASKPATA